MPPHTRAHPHISLAFVHPGPASALWSLASIPSVRYLPSAPHPLSLSVIPGLTSPPLTFLSNPAPRSRLRATSRFRCYQLECAPCGRVSSPIPRLAKGPSPPPPLPSYPFPSPTQSHRHRAYGAALLRRLDRQATTLQTSPGAPFWWAAGRQHFPFPSHPPQPSVPAHSLDTVSSSVAFYPPSAPLSLARLQVDLSSLRTLLP